MYYNGRIWKEKVQRVCYIKHQVSRMQVFPQSPIQETKFFCFFFYISQHLEIKTKIYSILRNIPIVRYRVHNFTVGKMFALHGKCNSLDK